eukprot:9077785-Ditylum_brightwellii.AAC.1
MHCLMLIVGEQNSRVEANGGENDTSTTAEGGQRLTTNKVNINNTINADSPANQNTPSKSNENAIGMTTEKNSTPCMSNMNTGIAFADDNNKNSNINSYNSTKKKNPDCLHRKDSITEGFSEEARLFAYGKIKSAPRKKKGIDFYRIKYDKACEKLLVYSTDVPGIQRI